MEAINLALYRPIVTDSKYDKYFENVSCNSSFLGEGTTTDGLKLMADWAKKYQYQTKQISKDLERNSVPETVNTIYNFLYNYIQYNADGYEQTLKSPACSYKMRFTGIDCKSYSLFASTILSNLSIPHKFRKVVQPSTPYRWSHVYVVVDYNGKELIIDGANHFNTEVDYLQKYDMKIQEQSLPYHGMNASLPYKNMDKAVRNFLSFLKELKSKYGLNPRVAQAIKNDVKKYLDAGVEPTVLITRKYVQINQNRHYLNLPKGLGFVEAVAEVVAESDSGGGGLFDTIFELINVGDFIDRGFGQVFDNGFDFSCWRASFPPSKARQETNEKIKNLLTNSNLKNAINSLDFTGIKIAANLLISELQLAVNDRLANSESTSKASCTRKGEKESHDMFKAALDKIYAALDGDFKVTYKTVKKPVTFTFRGGTITRSTTVKEVATISLKNQQNPTNPVNGDSNGNPQKKSNTKLIGTLATFLGTGFFLFK